MKSNFTELQRCSVGSRLCDKPWRKEEVWISNRSLGATWKLSGELGDVKSDFPQWSAGMNGVDKSS